jgi:hypothetical protein
MTKYESARQSAKSFLHIRASIIRHLFDIRPSTLDIPFRRTFNTTMTPHIPRCLFVR